MDIRCWRPNYLKPECNLMIDLFDYNWLLDCWLHHFKDKGKTIEAIFLESVAGIPLSKVMNSALDIMENILIKRHPPKTNRKYTWTYKGVIEKRYGIATGTPMTLKAIADDIGFVGTERVRQIEARAMRVLKYDKGIQNILKSYINPICALT